MAAAGAVVCGGAGLVVLEGSDVGDVDVEDDDESSRMAGALRPPRSVAAGCHRDEVPASGRGGDAVAGAGDGGGGVVVVGVVVVVVVVAGGTVVVVGGGGGGAVVGGRVDGGGGVVVVVEGGGVFSVQAATVTTPRPRIKKACGPWTASVAANMALASLSGTDARAPTGGGVTSRPPWSSSTGEA